MTFSACEALQQLPRLVYGLLRCPLLSPGPQQHGDLQAYLQHLWGCLPPQVGSSSAAYTAVLATACRIHSCAGHRLPHAELHACSSHSYSCRTTLCATEGSCLVRVLLQPDTTCLPLHRPVTAASQPHSLTASQPHSKMHADLRYAVCCSCCAALRYLPPQHPSTPARHHHHYHRHTTTTTTTTTTTHAPHMHHTC
jgi:hypothetical protein